MKTSLTTRLVLSLVFAGATAAAHAQYIWLDEHGVKQFSDQPPPSSISKKQILKEPGRAMRSISDSEPENSDDDSAKADTAPKTTEEKNADYIKRRAEKADKAKKAAEKAQAEADKAKNCERARQYQNSLASGERISTTGENGEHSFMSDEQRAQDMNENRQILQDCQ